MNLLIISPAFAPFSGVGANRMISLATYLRDKGVNITVVRQSPDSIANELANASTPDGINYIDVNTLGSFKEMENAYQEAVNDLLSIRNFDLAIVSTGPFYTIKAASSIKSNYNLDYILEFRDLWVYESRRYDSISNDIKRLLLRVPHIFKERQAVNKAKNIVVVTEGDKKIMQEFYPFKADNIHVIMNGYDDSRIKQVQISHSFDDAIYIGVFGKLAYYNVQNAKLLFVGVKKLIELGYNIKLLHIGPPEKEIPNIIDDLGFPESNYINVGSVDYAVGIEYLKKARICAIIYASRTGLGTKIFDYIYLNKPVVLISSLNSALADFVAKFKNGYVCEDLTEVFQTLKNIIENDISFLDSPTMTAPYSRKFQNQKYYALIKETIGDTLNEL